jgi:hypothetical protein
MISAVEASGRDGMRGPLLRSQREGVLVGARRCVFARRFSAVLGHRIDAVPLAPSPD